MVNFINVKEADLSKRTLQDMELDDRVPSKKVSTDKDWEVIEMLHKVLKPLKSAMIFL